MKTDEFKKKGQGSKWDIFYGTLLKSLTIQTFQTGNKNGSKFLTEAMSQKMCLKGIKI